MTGDAVALELPQRRIWPAGLITGVMFVIFAGVGWQVVSMVMRPVRDVFDLMTMLFMGFWLLGWSVGVFFLGAITILLFFYKESARLQQGRLLYVPRLGPIKIIIDYELARMRNVRVERADADDKAKVRFDYDEDTRTLGDTMPSADAERLAQTLKGAGASASAGSIGQTQSDRESFSTSTAKKIPDPVVADPIDTSESSSQTLIPVLMLIGANMLPLAGVLFFGWDLPTVMVLFWAESAVIGFYTALKMASHRKDLGDRRAVLHRPFRRLHGDALHVHLPDVYSWPPRGRCRSPARERRSSRYSCPSGFRWPRSLSAMASPLSRISSAGVNTGERPCRR